MPRREAQYRTAKEYWREKRKALENGVRLFPSAGELNDGYYVEKKKKSAAIQVIGSIHNAAKEEESEGKSYQTTAAPLWRPKPRAELQLVEAERVSTKRLLREVVGAKYASFGGSLEDGFSPTGLVCYILGRLGRPVKECSSEYFWSTAGTFIDHRIYGFEPGDILFFSLYSESEQGNKLLVAICYDENDMVYSSFTRKKVIKRSYRHNFWRERFVGAKRIID